MNQQYIEQVLSELEQPMIETLRTLVRIPSVKADPLPGAPFGQPARDALDKALEICAELGFDCENIDGYAGHADLGEGPTEDALAVLGHLDVVPIGDNWTCEPFGAEIRDGKMYGRGTSDDKGPVVAAMYAMAAVKRLGLPLKRKIRLIMGTDEESGWEDMRYYRKVCGMPRSGFSPDADYPIINIEKGSLHLDIWGKLSDQGLQVIRFDTGDRYNVVPGKAEALICGDQALADKINAIDFGWQVTAEATAEGVILRTEGIPGHAAIPEGTLNAIGLMLKTLKALGVEGDLKKLADVIGVEYDGKSLGIKMEDAVSGPLTSNMGIIRADKNGLRVTLDLRCPILADLQGIADQAARALPDMKVEITSRTEPHYVSADSELVRKLLGAYEKVTGEKGYAMAIGGGTYAKCLEEGVAFGALFPGEPELAHHADEFISLDSLRKNLRIFTYALIALACDEVED